MWYEAHRNKFEKGGKLFGRDEFDKLLGHCQAHADHADHPCCFFAEELIQAYPEAKFILTTKPKDDITVRRDCGLRQSIRFTLLSLLLGCSDHKHRIISSICGRLINHIGEGSSMSKTLAARRPLLTLFCALGWLLRVHNRYAFLVYQMDMHRLLGENFTVDSKRRYREHNDWIRSLVPKEKLLELRLGQYGGSLCANFLMPDVA